MSLFISSATASSGSNESPVNEAIAQLAVSVALAKRQGRLPQGPSLDVTFMLPGRFEKPDFPGMRMGGYTEGSDTLFFERAVPPSIVHSEKAKEYVAIVMQDVISNAGAFFRENAIAFDSRQWRQVIQLLAGADVSLFRQA